MFDHQDFDNYPYEEIPLNQDLYLMDEKWMVEYEKSLLEIFDRTDGDWEPVGYISYAAARSIGEFNVELSWYANTSNRFHEVPISLPRDQFVVCVGSSKYDEKPHIFVKSEWLDQLHLQYFSVFAMVDAINVKKALSKGLLTRGKLVRLRERIDELAERHEDILFISFADSLLLKSNWQVGSYNNDVKYSYAPEIFIQLTLELQSVYREVLDLDIYAVLTQGSNAYYDDALSHTSKTGNHISLNSLGIPFAQLMYIEQTARTAIKCATHEAAELYMDKTFFNSLRFVLEFKKDSISRNEYQDPMTSEEGRYYIANCKQVIENLR